MSMGTMMTIDNLNRRKREQLQPVQEPLVTPVQEPLSAFLNAIGYRQVFCPALKIIVCFCRVSPSLAWNIYGAFS